MLLGVTLGQTTILKILGDGKSAKLINADELCVDGQSCHHRKDKVWVTLDLLAESANDTRKGLLLLLFGLLQIAEGGTFLLGLLLDIHIFDTTQEE